MKRIAVLLLLGALASSVSALEFKNVLWDRAFSPNGDGVQDTSPVSFLVQSEDSLRVVAALIASGSETPPPPENQLVMLHYSDDPMGTSGSLHLSWSGLDAFDQPYPDGFYFLHLYAATDSDTLWLDPPGELEINTVAPSFLSTAVEPQPFTPLKVGADTLQQVHFTSADFDTLTDTATLELLAGDELSGSYQIRLLQRDPDYALHTGEGTRYRFLWDGTDMAGSRTDGIYGGVIRLEDDAGNAVEAEVSLDLDVLAPTFTVLGAGGWEEGATRFDFNPDDLPDSLWVRAEDRHGVDSCKVAWGMEAPYDTLGLPSGGGEGYEDFVFALPLSWAADSTYKIRLDARDGQGQWKSELGSPATLTLVIDSRSPATPVWTSAGGERIQEFQQIRGWLGETGLTVFLYRDEAPLPVDTTQVTSTEYVFDLFLEEGSQSFRTQAMDAAGNLSDTSEVLTLVYRPGAAVRMPGRFRGAGDEAIQVNTPSEAERVEIRFFSLDGALLRGGSYALLDAGTRSLAMGGSGLLHDAGLEALFLQPASLTSLDRWEAGAFHQHYGGGLPLQATTLGLAVGSGHRLALDRRYESDSEVALGAVFQYLGATLADDSSWGEWTFAGVAAWSPLRWFSVGGRARYSGGGSEDGVDAGHSVAMDLGLRMRLLHPGLEAGVLVQNFYHRFDWDEGGSYRHEPSTVLSLGWDRFTPPWMGGRWRGELRLTQHRSQAESYGGGVECALLDGMASLRAGLVAWRQSDERMTPSFGGGVQAGAYRFDYAFSPDGDGGMAARHRFSVIRRSSR